MNDENTHTDRIRPTIVRGALALFGALALLGSACGDTETDAASDTPPAVEDVASENVQEVADELVYTGPAVSYSTGPGPYAVVADGTDLWVTNLDDEVLTLSRLDPETGERTDYETGSYGRHMAVTFDGARLWSVGSDGAVSRIDPADGSFDLFETDSLGGVPSLGVVFDGTDIWITNPVENTVTRMNAEDGSRVQFETGVEPTQVLFDGTSIWVANSGDDTVSRIDPADGTRVDFPTGANPIGLAFDGTNVWVTNAADNTVSRIDAADGTRVDFETGIEPFGVAVADSSVWIVNAADGTVSRMNPTDGTRIDVRTGAIPRFIAFDGTYLWVTNNGDDSISRIDPAAIADPAA